MLYRCFDGCRVMKAVVIEANQRFHVGSVKSPSLGFRSIASAVHDVLSSTQCSAKVTDKYRFLMLGIADAT